MHHSRDEQSDLVQRLSGQMDALGKAKVESLVEKIEKATKDLGLGATGHYPEGALDATDEGEIRIAIAADQEEEKVIINFGKPVAWIGFSPQQARELAEALRQKSYVAQGRK